MIFLAFDLETTGLDTKTCEIIELGYALYNYDLSSSPIHTAGFICHSKHPITTEIEDITGISHKIQTYIGVPLVDALMELTRVLSTYKVEFLVAHNGLEFDVPVLKRALLMNGFNVELPTCIDTKIDLPFTKVFKSTSLISLSAEHGFLNPFPHRALFDSLSCFKLMQNYDITYIIKSAITKLIEVKAVVSYDDRELAKKAGYNWDGDRKLWVKKLREVELEKETQRRPFQVVKIASL